MPRSTKKGYYLDHNLEKKVAKISAQKEKEPVDTKSRRSMIIPEMVGCTIRVHNGREYIPTYITKNMVGHKLGEFAPPRTFKGHKGQKDKKK